MCNDVSHIYACKNTRKGTYNIYSSTLDPSAIRNIRHTNKEISLVYSYKLATAIGGIRLNWRKQGDLVQSERQEGEVK